MGSLEELLPLTTSPFDVQRTHDVPLEGGVSSMNLKAKSSKVPINVMFYEQNTILNGNSGKHGPPCGVDGGSLEPIAIIGMSMKFPQGVESSESFWKMLLKKHCASTEYPKDRMNIEAFYDSKNKKQSKMSTRKAHFIDGDYRAFDAPFFSVPPVEAGTMDPQHRILLESTYHALENAGIPMETIAGSNTSVHVGCFTNDFTTINWKDAQNIPKYSATGVASSILSNRLSWFFDLHGPSMTIDTACSSGMVALDLACNQLWSGGSNMGIVAGANLIFSPEMNIALSNMNFLSPDGKCYSFDHRANGYARGEGFGVLVLKPVFQAIEDGDNIRALIRSTGTNQDGYTSGGITQPSKELQARLIVETYRKANLDMGITRFFEAHGTGTAIGDPVEARAIGESFRKYRSTDNPLYVGAVKSNLGHLEGTSGIAGIIKTVLALEKGVIPPNTNFECANPNIDMEFLRIEFPEHPIPWPSLGVRRASVNSFGFGGSNAHVILDDAFHYLNSAGLTRAHQDVTTTLLKDISYHVRGPEQRNGTVGSDETPPVNMSHRLLLLSAADEGSLLRLMKTYSQHFADMKKPLNDKFLNDLVYTTNTRRSSLAWKSYAVINSPYELSQLEQKMSKPLRLQPLELRLGFVFTGQGAQWHAMGRELLISPVFKESFYHTETYLRLCGCKWSLIGELTADNNSTRVNEPEFSQTLCTAVQIALVDLFKHLCITPSVVVGHSSGEIAAAYCAGYLSHRSAVKVAYYRGVLASRLANSSMRKNSMASIGLSHGQLSAQIHELGQTQKSQFNASVITISCINSPKNVTISGPEYAVDILIVHLQKQDIFARKLIVNVAYHSPQMNEIASEYLEAIQNLDKGSETGKTLMMSSVTRKLVSSDDVCAGQYWVQNMISPVQFFDAIQNCSFRSSKNTIVKTLDRSHLRQVTTNAWVEIGPHSALRGPIRDILKSVRRSDKVTYISALTRNRSAMETMLEAVGILFCQNLKIDLAKANELCLDSSQTPQLLADLPQYPFNHSILYWEESQQSKGFRLRQHANHDLLGTQVIDWNPLEAKWRFIIKADELPWIKDHKINGSLLYPAAGMLVMAIEAMKLLIEDREPIGFEIKNVNFYAPIIISMAPEGTETQITLQDMTSSGSKDSMVHQFRVHVRKSDQEWEEVCRGFVRADYGRSVSEVDNGKEAENVMLKLKSLHCQAAATCTTTIKSAEMYQQFAEEIGIEYGPTFQPLDEIRYNDYGEAIANIIPFKWLEDIHRELDSARSQVIHPSTLDGVFQLAFAALSKGGSVSMPTMIPTRIGRAWISCLGAGSSYIDIEQVHARAHLNSQRSGQASLSVLAQPDQGLRIQLEEFEMTAISSTKNVSPELKDAKPICYHMDWKVDLDTLDTYHTQQYCESARKPEPDPFEWYRDFELLALSFSAQALKDLKKLNQEPVPTLQRYASWLQTQIRRDLDSTPQCRVQEREALFYDANHLRMLCDRMTKSKRGELYVEVGRHLTNMLLGEIDPLEILFRDKNLLTDFYAELNATSQAFGSAARYIEAAAHKRPNMKFLEIGAGTGASTSLFLETLTHQGSSTRYEQYMFTDISPSFFGEARERFHREKRMNFAVLNIDEDPCAQGFNEEYDIVIAALVLHATKDLDVTLQNVRKLLKPGGKLIFTELTVPNMTRTGFAFGLLPGWWLSAEENRQQSPCVTEHEWNEVLRRNGFSGTDLVLRDHQSEECHVWSFLIATAMPSVSRSVANPKFLNSSQHPKVNLILDKNSQIQVTLSQELRRQFEIVEVTLSEVGSTDDHGSQDYVMLVDLERPVLPTLEPISFAALQKLLGSARTLLWVTAGGGRSSNPDHGMIQGLCRVSRHENNKVALTTLDLEVIGALPSSNHATHIGRVFHATASGKETGEFEPQYSEIDGLLHINRIYQAEYLNDHIFTRTARPVLLQEFGAGPPLKLNVRARGLLDSLEFVVDDSTNNLLESYEVEVEVRAIGVNFKECLTVLGRVDTDTIGSECAGVVSRVGNNCEPFKTGDRVVICVNDSYRTYARVKVDQVFLIPDEITFAEAAALPTAFLTAYYSIHEVARLRINETVLIHAASGGTGQAAIQLAQCIGAEVFATVGSLAKKKLLMDIYHLPEDHIFYSRDLSFADGIRRMTNGRGVDMVLNSLSGDGLVASWECIAPFGRFLEIGRKDIDSRGMLPMFPFIKNTTFAGVDLTGLLDQQRALGREMMESILSMMQAGKLRPQYPLHMYSISELEQAFRFIQSGKSSGKIIVEIDKKAMVPTVQASDSSYLLNPNATYLISGGLGGLGRSLSRWLFKRGAKNLLLLSRSGPTGNEKAQSLIAELVAKGVRIECPVCDVSDITSLQIVIDQYQSTMPPIKGCFQSSMVLRDGDFTTMSISDWKQATLPKVSGSWNLHAVLPKELDFFIMLSSACGIFGNSGQSNYAAGNTYQDALAEYRVSLGEKATSLDLGIVLGEGFVAENSQVRDRLLRVGLLLPLQQDELFALFDYYCNPCLNSLPARYQSQVITGLELPANLAARGKDVPLALRQPLFRQMHQIDGSGQIASTETTRAVDLKALYTGAGSLPEAGVIVAEGLKSKLSRIMGIPHDEIDLQHRVESYGVDSLVAVELRNWLAKEMSADVAVFEILGNATLANVGMTVASKSTFRRESWGEL
ncbi:hypothetical protein MMC27_006603 [Xylographa pallens]|nr:hypothetical protein [Xylographa pallens]